MQLKILMPSATFAEKNDVVSIVAETTQGSFGILPRRLDCVSILRSGIFTYTSEADGEVFIALDKGILVKTGDRVMVSTRRAIGGTNLETLHALVEKEFLKVDEEELKWQSTLLKLESGFLRRFADFRTHE